MLGKLSASLVLLAGGVAPATSQQHTLCPSGALVEGTVTDESGAVIPAATVQSSTGQVAATDAAGHYTFPCLPAGTIHLNFTAQGFTSADRSVLLRPGKPARADARLLIATVRTDVAITADDNGGTDQRTTGSRTLNSDDVRQLADDPDEFSRQLQALAAEGGSMPGTAVLTVDGFQNASALPPKASIASIRINPDMFSSEYEQAPYLGGRVEIFTKPGADLLHGALFFTDSDASFNATDPFSSTATPAGKRRYGFELSGPIVPSRSDISLALEKRDIDEFNVVNALGLDPKEQQIALHQTVPAPQRLWIASARGDWQAGKSDVATLSFAANVNDLGDQGVGGLVLEQAGYAARASEEDLRFSNLQTIGATLLHQTRLGYTSKRSEQQPNSTAASLQVQGYFQGGGSTSQALNNRERDLEVDDTWMITRGSHTISAGAQSLGIFVHNSDPDTFNGQYVFGGGAAPVLGANGAPTDQVATISGLEQFRRATLNLPGGTPTTFQLGSGTPLVSFTQWRLALYGNDLEKLNSHLSLTAGLRYQTQTAPTSRNLSPRLGMAWSLDRKATWTVHLRAGLFHDPNPISYASEAYRLNGSRQQQVTVYSPSFSSPLTPIAGSTQVSTQASFPATLAQVSSLQTHLSVEKNLPQNWHAGATFYWAANWGSVRTLNRNAPIVPASFGAPPDPSSALHAPRPLAPYENILEFQNSGHLSGGIFVAGAGRNDGKHFGLSVTFVHQNLRSDADSNGSTSPQSSYSERGEASRVSGDSRNGVYAYGTVHLPCKLDLTSIVDALSGQAFNITSGTDSNGDGNFNDRPSYAYGTGDGVYATKYGLLTTNTVNGNVPRNAGTMPSRIHADTNVSRAFLLNRKNAEHPRTLTVTARSSNLLNHTNVTTVGTVLPSANFAQPITAETARRVELGIRFAF